MAVFGCAGCGAVLTAPVSRVALPAHAHQMYGHDLLPTLMEPGTYAVDPEPSGPPWPRWDELGSGEAEARGVYAPVYALSYGAPGAVAVAPGDVRGTVLLPDRYGGFCCGLDGRDGPNLACAQCGQAVATRIDDCSLWQAVWLTPDAVRCLPDAGPADRVVGWDALLEREPTPPIEQSGAWAPQWEAAIGKALPHLLVASAGAPVAVPDGPLAEILRRALDALLPPGPQAKTLALTGPGMSPPDADIALVPMHPQTGEEWEPPGTAEAVPLAFDVWLYLAFQDDLAVPNDRVPVPIAGGLPKGVHRDDPPPLNPAWRFRADWRIFLHTLARLPEVRRPWLRRIYDSVQARPYGFPF